MALMVWVLGRMFVSISGLRKTEIMVDWESRRIQAESIPCKLSLAARTIAHCIIVVGGTVKFETVVALLSLDEAGVAVAF